MEMNCIFSNNIPRGIYYQYYHHGTSKVYLIKWPVSVNWLVLHITLEYYLNYDHTSS